jgi:hypothetical protein
MGKTYIPWYHVGHIGIVEEDQKKQPAKKPHPKPKH